MQVKQGDKEKSGKEVADQPENKRKLASQLRGSGKIVSEIGLFGKISIIHPAHIPPHLHTGDSMRKKKRGKVKLY